jgi:hypothetical protein
VEQQLDLRQCQQLAHSSSVGLPLPTCVASKSARSGIGMTNLLQSPLLNLNQLASVESRSQETGNSAATVHAVRLLPRALAGAAHSEFRVAERIEARQIDVPVVQGIQTHRTEERFSRFHQKDRSGEPAVIETTPEVHT